MNKLLKIHQKSQNHQQGASYLAVLILISIIISLIAFSIKAAGGTVILSGARDVRRSADAHQITTALSLYYNDHNGFPEYTGKNSQPGWQILTSALEPEYMPEVPNDPLNTKGYAYAYWSDGAVAKIKYFSEESNKIIERSVY